MALYVLLGSKRNRRTNLSQENVQKSKLKIILKFRHLCDRIGSVKLPLLSAMSFSITGSLIMSLGRNLNMLYLGRFLMGFGWGIDGPIVGKGTPGITIFVIIWNFYCFKSSL